jgi:DnaJ-class molecular chaperone
MEASKIEDGAAGVRDHMGGERIKPVPTCFYCGGSGVDAMSDDECHMCGGTGNRRERKGLNDDAWGFSEQSGDEVEAN